MILRCLALGAASIALVGCDSLPTDPDWREGVETVNDCLDRLTKSSTTRPRMESDEGIWIPAFTYDITHVSPHDFRSLAQLEEGETPATLVTVVSGGSSTQNARDRFADTPAVFEGAILQADDPALYKVRGEADLHRNLKRQGCERQISGMRLISYRFTSEESQVDDELPAHPITNAQQRLILDKGL
ncbi:MAG: hypothetical protein ABJN35_05565 [Erythrobacter sp.]